MANKTATTKSKTKQEPVEEVEETATESSWGVKDLLDHIEAQTGKAYQPATIRVLLRKLVKEETIERGDGRWAFTGADDPAVIAIVDAVSKGRAEKDADASDEEAADEKPAKKAPVKRKTRAKKEPEPEEDEEDEELDLEDL